MMAGLRNLLYDEPISIPTRIAKFRHNANLLLEFTEMVEILLRSGLSVKDSLEMVSASSKKSKTAELSRYLLQGIHRGLSIANTISTVGDFFPPLYYGMVKFGDMVGSMEQIFPRLCTYLQEQKKIRENIISALIYPALVLFLAVTGAAALIVFILPKLELFFEAFTLSDESNSLKSNILIMKCLLMIFIWLIAAIMISIPALRKIRQGKAEFAILLDRRLLKIPIIGKVLQSWEMLNFSFAMEILIGGGIPVEAALYESARLISNSALKQGALAVWKRVTNGGSMAKNFSENPLFPEYFCRWIAIGEQAKRIEWVFAQIRKYYQEEIERKTSRLIQLIEPCMIAITGLIITAIAVGLILPIFSILGNLL